MRKIVTFVSSLLFVSAAAMAAETQTFMPPNNLHLQDNKMAGSMTEAQFNAVIARAESIYAPLISQFGATLTINRLWSDATVNASAEQPSPTSWKVNMYGGLARRAEVTEDGFAMVLCHEIGHHAGGYPFVQGWAANEGQSDMFATGTCASKIFTTNAELSARAYNEVPADMKAKCDVAHADSADRDICYRSLAAGKSLADLLAALNSTGAVSFATPDTSTVTRTNSSHPAAQCRLDTYVASALCGSNTWDDTIIPGKTQTSRNSMAAQEEAFAHSCADGVGARPRCWFAALTTDPVPSECPFGDPIICEFICQLDPSQPYCAR